FLQDGVDVFYGSFEETSAPRYLNIDLNRDVTQVRWHNLSTTSISVQAFEVYTVGALKTTAAPLAYVDENGNPANFGGAGYMGSTLIADMTTKPTNIWHVIITTTDLGTLSVRGSDGKVYLWRNIPATASATTYDITVDRLVQQLIWTIPAPSVGRQAADFQIFERDTAFGGGRVYAFNAANGAIKWQYPAAGQPAAAPIFSSPALAPDGETLFVGTTGGSLLAFRASDGALLWRREAFQSIFSPLVLVDNPGGADVFAPDLEGNFHLWHGATGQEMTGWPAPAQGPCENAGAVTADNQAYLVSSHGRVYFLDLNARTYGSQTLAVPTTDPNGDTWSDNSLTYDPSDRAVTLIGRIQPKFTDNVGAALTNYLPASGGQKVRLGFQRNSGTMFAAAYVTDDGKVGIEGEPAVSLPASSKPADGVELAITVRADNTGQYRYYGFYRTIDTGGNFTGQFLPLGQDINAGNPPPLHPFLQGIDIDAPGFTPRGSDLTIYTGYAPVGSNIYGPLASVVDEAQTDVLSNPVLDSLGHLFFGTDAGSLFCLRPQTEWASGLNPVLWQYLPDRSVLYTGLYEAAVAGQTNLKVSNLTGFRVNDPVQITRPDGSLPESLGVITAITPKPDPFTFDLAVAAPEATTTQIHVVTPPQLPPVPPLPALNLNNVQPGYAVYMLPPPTASNSTQTMNFVGNVVSANSATGIVTLDRPITQIDLDGDGVAGESYPVADPPGITQVFIEQPFGYITVSRGPSRTRDVGDLIRMMRGQAMPIHSSPSLGPLETVYVGAQDGLLYAIGPAGPAGDPPTLPDLPVQEQTDIWWTFHHDNQRTGFVERPGAYYSTYRWYRDIGATLESSPAMGFADATAPLGVLYQGTVEAPTDINGQTVTNNTGGALVSVDASNGNVRWQYDDNGTLGKVFSSPAVYISTRTDASDKVMKDELVVFGTMDYPRAFLDLVTDALIVNPTPPPDDLYVAANLGRDRLLMGDQVIALRVNDAAQFAPGMNIY
ncbi:MAG TPA: PQQ-binding-like beta-propeller repeat protein, partial [Armatimonadota bacterium]